MKIVVWKLKPEFEKERGEGSSKKIIFRKKNIIKTEKFICVIREKDKYHN